MAVFEYIAKDSTGNILSGSYTDVESIRQLRQEMKKLGYSLVKAHKEKQFFGKKARIKKSDIVTFAYELAGMYTAGLSIVRCLETMESQTENGSLKSVIIDIKQKVETGLPLHEAFAAHREVFSDFFIGMVEAGQTGGKLGETLNMAANYLEKQEELKSKVRSAFAYPIVVSVMCMIIVSALVVFVIPVFQKMYSQLHVTLPLPTLILVAISEAARRFWAIIIPGVAIMIYVCRKILKIPEVKIWLDSIKLKIPVFGPLNRLVVVSRFMRTFAMMLSAGIGIVESLELAKRIVGNKVMEDVGTAIQEKIMVGSSLAEPMAEFNIFPPIIHQLAGAGEEAGVLPEMLLKGVDFLDAAIERKVQSLLTKLEPILSVVLGSIVGGILLGVYLPMFDYMGQIK